LPVLTKSTAILLPFLSRINLPLWSFLYPNASTLLVPLIVTRLIEIPFSLFSQIGFSVRFEKASLLLPLYSNKRAFNISLIFGSTTFSIFNSGVISFLFV
jgi:hypothetical protein